MFIDIIKCEELYRVLNNNIIQVFDFVRMYIDVWENMYFKLNKLLRKFINFFFICKGLRVLESQKNFKEKKIFIFFQEVYI